MRGRLSSHLFSARSAGPNRNDKIIEYVDKKKGLELNQP